MRLCYVLLASAAALLASTDVVSANLDFDQKKISSVTAAEEDRNVKRLLRVTKTDDEDAADASTTDEERMLINALFEKILAAGETVRVAVKPQKYQKWIANGLTPSAVRVDVMGIQPWTLHRMQAIADHPDFLQYAKFMVKYALNQAKAANAAT